MTFYWGDSFDHYTDVSKKWNGYFGTKPTITAGIGRNSTAGLRCPGSAGSNYQVIAETYGAAQADYVHFAVKPPTTFTNSIRILDFVDGSVYQCYIQINTDGSIQAYKATAGILNPVLLGTATRNLELGSYQHLQVYCSISNSAGAFTVKLNNVAVLTLTNVDNRTTANNQMTSVRIGTTGAVEGNWDFDDFIHTDVGFLGDVKLVSRFPTQDGTYKEWTRSTGADNFANVDENPPNDDTDYNETGTVNNRDSFVVEDVSGTGTVKVVLGNMYSRKTDENSVSVNLLARSGGVDAVGNAQSIIDTYFVQQSFMVNDPNTGSPFTITAFNAAEFGYKRTV